MKNKLFIAILLMTSVSAFADDNYVTLSPGTELQMTAGEELTVQCGEYDPLPRCSLRESQDGGITVMIGDNAVATFTGFSLATSRIKKLKELELCR